MSWDQTFNIYDERTAYVDLTKVENVPTDMWTVPGQYGDARRKRMKPDTLTVVWRNNPRTPGWVIHRVTITGRYVHKQAFGTLLNLEYFDCGNQKKELEDWMSDLIKKVSPRVKEFYFDD